VIVRQEALHLSVTQHRFEKFSCNIAIQQTVAVLREGRVVPKIVDSEADEPAEQQIVINLLHELALRAHGIKRLQERGAQSRSGATDCRSVPS
jgi:NAD-dependent DNA ligase